MNRPPIPSEQNPKQHHERPGEPPANWPEDPQVEEEQALDQIYQQEEADRDEELTTRRREPLKNQRL